MTITKSTTVIINKTTIRRIKTTIIINKTTIKTNTKNYSNKKTVITIAKQLY